MAKLAGNAIPFCIVTHNFSFESNDSGASYTSIKYDPRGAYPNETNPLGNPPYPGKTYAGGPNWVH
jgi:hypothetical protein